jgi:hypothetical protein
MEPFAPHDPGLDRERFWDGGSLHETLRSMGWYREHDHDQDDDQGGSYEHGGFLKGGCPGGIFAEKGKP